MLLSILVGPFELISGALFFMSIGACIMQCLPDPPLRKDIDLGKTKTSSKIVPMHEDIEAHIGSDRLYEWRKAEKEN